MSTLSGSRMRSVSSLLNPTSFILYTCSLVATAGVFSQTSIFDAMDSNSTCEQLDCKNGNSCQMSASSYNGSDWSAYSVICLCRGKWAGPKCELELRLFVYSIQPESVLLDLQQIPDSIGDAHVLSTKNPTPFHVKEFSIFVWNLNALNECRILQLRSDVLQREKIRVSGLEGGEKYLACFSNGHVDSCSLFADKSNDYLSKEHSCVEFVMDVNQTSSAYMQIVATVCVVAVFFLVFSMFLYVHRRIFVIQLCLHIFCCRNCKYCRSISRAKKHGEVRRMRKQMRDVSGDVLMPDDIPIEFDEFEGENDLSSAMYSCDSLGMEEYAENSGELCDLKLLPRRPTSLDINFRPQEQATNTENIDFLYENQKLISPIYSPQDHNVMKLAYLEDDLIPGNYDGLGQQNDTGGINVRNQTKERPFLSFNAEENVTDLQENTTMHAQYPLNYQSYLPNKEHNQHHRFSSQTLPRSFISRTSSLPVGYNMNFPRRMLSLYSYKEPDLLLSTLPSPHQDFIRGIDSFHQTHNISPFPFQARIESQHDISPEIEYSDASGDYRYPPPVIDDTSNHRNRLFRDQPRRSFTAHDIKMRNLQYPRPRRCERPRSMPIDYFLRQHELATAPLNHHPLHSTSKPSYPYYHSNTSHINQNILSPYSHIPSAETFRQKTCQLETESFASLENQQQMWPYVLKNQPLNVPPSHFKQFQNRDGNFLSLPRTAKSKYSYEPRSFENANKSETFSSHSLPRVKKPKLSYDLETFEDTNKTETFLSHSLPRVKKRISKAAKRPHRLNLRSRTSDFPIKTQTFQTPFSKNIDSPQNSTHKFNQCEYDKFFSLPNTPLKPTSPKPMETLKDHFEKNLFSKNPTSSQIPENQEFLDLQSPLAEDRNKLESRGKAKRFSKWAINSMSSKGEKDFTVLADDTYKCFFKRDPNVDKEINEENYSSLDLSCSHATSSQDGKTFSIESEDVSAKKLPTSKSSTEFKFLQPLRYRAGSISCFADNTVNLVTPFCAEFTDNSPLIGRHQKATEMDCVAKFSKSMETKCTEKLQCTDEEITRISKSVGVERELDELENANLEPKAWEIIA